MTPEAATQGGATLARQNNACLISYVPLCVPQLSFLWARGRALPTATTLCEARGPPPGSPPYKQLTVFPIFCTAANGKHDMMLMSSSHSHFSGVLTLREFGSAPQTALIVRGPLA